jgi:hypothetical protein
MFYSVLNIFVINMIRYNFLILTLLLSGCVGQRLPLTTLYESLQCGVKEVGVSILHEQRELDNIFNYSGVIISDAKQNNAPRLKESENVVVVSMGEKPSAGYSLYLKENMAEVKNNILNIEIIFQDLAENDMAASIVTTPCIIVSVEKAKYDAINVGDYVTNIQ